MTTRNRSGSPGARPVRDIRAVTAGSRLANYLANYLASHLANNRTDDGADHGADEGVGQRGARDCPAWSRALRWTLPRSLPGSRPWALVLLAGLLILSGCGLKLPGMPAAPELPPMPPMPPLEAPTKALALTIIASPGMNPTPTGQAAPLLVRVYSLTSDARLMTASLSALLADDATALGSDLIAREELRLVPGEQRIIEQRLDPATRVIGVMAAYRQTDGIRWRAALPVVAGPVNRFDLTLGARELTLTP